MHYLIMRETGETGNGRVIFFQSALGAAIAYHHSSDTIPKSNFGQMKRIINGAQLDIFEPEKMAGKHLDSVEVTKGIKSEIRRRRLKIQYGHYTNSLRRHPVIRLAGCWLRNFDFQIGDSVEIEITKGHISITKVPVKK